MILFYFILIYVLPKRNISHLISWLAALDGFLLVFCQEITLKSLSKQILIINNNIKWLVDPINSSFFTLYWSHFIVVWSFLFHLEGFWHEEGVMVITFVFKRGFRKHTCTSGSWIPYSFRCWGLRHGELIIFHAGSVAFCM